MMGDKSGSRRTGKETEGDRRKRGDALWNLVPFLHLHEDADVRNPLEITVAFPYFLLFYRRIIRIFGLRNLSFWTRMQLRRGISFTDSDLDLDNLICEGKYIWR